MNIISFALMSSGKPCHWINELTGQWLDILFAIDIIWKWNKYVVVKCKKN